MIYEVEAEVKLLKHPSTSLQDPQQSEFTFKQQHCYCIQLNKLYIYIKKGKMDQTVCMECQANCLHLRLD